MNENNFSGLWLRIHLNPDPVPHPSFHVNPDPVSVSLSVSGSGDCINPDQQPWINKLESMLKILNNLARAGHDSALPYVSTVNTIRATVNR
jgi:hypothetical protein